MKIKCFIQNINFYRDQYEERGEVDLETAIGIFQDFPFEEQLKEADGHSRTFVFPGLVYQDEAGNALSIWAENDKGFSLRYENRRQSCEFSLALDIEYNPEGHVPEEFIEALFNGAIEQELVLKDKKSKEEDNLEEEVTEALLNSMTYGRKGEFSALLDKGETNDGIHVFTGKVLQFSALGLVVLTLLFCWILYRFYTKQVEPAQYNFALPHSRYHNHSLTSTVTSLLFILSGVLFLRKKNIIVTINTNEKTLEFESSKTYRKVNRDEIKDCYIYYSRRQRRSFLNYYPPSLIITLNDNSKLIIPGAITQPRNIIDLLGLNYRGNA